MNLNNIKSGIPTWRFNICFGKSILAIPTGLDFSDILGSKSVVDMDSNRCSTVARLESLNAAPNPLPRYFFRKDRFGVLYQRAWNNYVMIMVWATQSSRLEQGYNPHEISMSKTHSTYATWYSDTSLNLKRKETNLMYKEIAFFAVLSCWGGGRAAQKLRGFQLFSMFICLHWICSIFY